MAQEQDPNRQSQYSSGYSGYSAQPNNTSGAQQYWQQSGYQQGDQQSAYDQYDQQQQQQYRTYQPPFSASDGRNAYDPTSTGMSGRTEAFLSYLLGPLSGLILFVVERKNRFVRFHAAQSCVFFGFAFILFFLVRLIGYLLAIIPFLGGLLGFVLNPVLACLAFVIVVPAGLAWIFLMIQSYRGITVRLPFFSNYAESMLARFTRKQKSTI